MPKCSLLKEEHIDPEVQEIFEELKEGFNTDEISDYFMLLAHNKGALRSTWLMYKHILIEGVVPRQVKEMIYLAVSVSKGCRYCSSSHLALCDMYQVEKDTIDTIINSIESLCPDRMRKIISFGVKVANEPSSITQKDYQELQADGLSMGEIVEIMTVATFCASGTQIAQAAGLDVEHSTVEYLSEHNLSIGF